MCGDTRPSTCTAGFSRGLISIAPPYACCDHDVVAATRLQLKADVLAAFIERSSLAPYASIGTIRLIGNRAS